MRNVGCKLSCFDGVSLYIGNRTFDPKTIACIVGHSVIDDCHRGRENVNGWTLEVATIHPKRVTGTRVVRNDVIGNVCSVWRRAWVIATLISIVVLTNLDGFLFRVLDRIVLDFDFRLAIDPETVVASNRTNCVSVSGNRRITNTESRTC